MTPTWPHDEHDCCPAFHRLMDNRMGVSRFKYGPMSRNYPFPANALASLEKRLAMYRDTGNIEWLVDVANFAMIEALYPAHPNAHFRATDSDESPGLVKDAE